MQIARPFACLQRSMAPLSRIEAQALSMPPAKLRARVLLETFHPLPHSQCLWSSRRACACFGAMPLVYGRQPHFVAGSPPSPIFHQGRHPDHISFPANTESVKTIRRCHCHWRRSRWMRSLSGGSTIWSTHDTHHTVLRQSGSMQLQSIVWRNWEGDHDERDRCAGRIGRKNYR